MVAKPTLLDAYNVSTGQRSPSSPQRSKSRPADGRRIMILVAGNRSERSPGPVSAKRKYEVTVIDIKGYIISIAE